MSLDTSADAELVRLAALRAMGPTARVLLALEMSDEIRLVTLDGIRQRHPDLAEPELIECLIELWHGAEIADAVRRSRRQSASA